MKYIRYQRKSSEQEERQALSIESQKIELEKKFPDLEIVADLEESKSAFLPENRPKFNQMIQMIRDGKADGIIAWHPDRLSRNEIDAATITYLVRTGIIKDLKFDSYFFENSPEGIMMLQSALSHSQYTSARTGRDAKRGLQSKAEKGWLPSGAKPGYMNDPFAPKGSKTIKKDPVRFPLIQKAWELMLTGNYTPPQILDKLNNEWGYRTPKRGRLGGKPMARSQIYRLFTDTFYYGEYEYPKGSGNWHQGKHGKMITKEEFDRVQILLGRKSRPCPKKHQFSFTGLVKCGECGGFVTAEEKWQVICSKCKKKFHRGEKTIACPQCETLIEKMKNPKILHYVYYHCTKRKSPNCTQGSIRLEELETQIDEFLSKIQISEKFKNWAIKYLNELNDKEAEDRNATIKSLQKTIGSCVKRLDNLLKLKISPQNTDGSLLSDEEFVNQKKAILEEKVQFEERLSSTDARIENWMNTAERVFDFAVHARYWFAKGTLEEKKTILSTIGQNLTLKDKKLRITSPKHFQLIGKAKETVPSISPWLEPEEKPYITANLEDSWSQNPSLLRG